MARGYLRMGSRNRRINHHRPAILLYYTDEKELWDVKIQLGDKVFLTSRFMLASFSNYFEVIFWGNFKESNFDVNTPIVLKDVDASTFEDILSAMFTGNIQVTDSNILALLKASDYLLLRSTYVEDQCYEYLITSKYKPPLTVALEILEYAHLTGIKKRFIDCLNTHILTHLTHYLKDVRLLEISFEVLDNLLENAGDLAFPEKGDALLKLVARWINYSREHRNKHRSRLMKRIEGLDVSMRCTLFLLNECENFIDETVSRDENVDWMLPNLKQLYIERPEEIVKLGTIMWSAEYTGMKCLPNRAEIVSQPFITSCNEKFIMSLLNPGIYPYDKLILTLRRHDDSEMSDIRTEFAIVSQKNGYGDLNNKGSISSTRNLIAADFNLLAIRFNDHIFIKNDRVIFKAYICRVTS